MIVLEESPRTPQALQLRWSREPHQLRPSNFYGGIPMKVGLPDTGKIFLRVQEVTAWIVLETETRIESCFLHAAFKSSTQAADAFHIRSPDLRHGWVSWWVRHLYFIICFDW